VTQFSQHLYYSGRLAEAFTLIDRAWEIADRINDAKIAFAVARTGGGCSAALGDPQAYRWYERELSRPRTANTRHARAVLSAVLGECFLLTGQTERVPALMAPMMTDPSSQSQGYVAFVQGRWEDAERYWRQTNERSRHAGGRDEVNGYPACRAWVLRILGKYNEAEAFLTEALSICGKEPLHWVEMWARPELALLFAETGRAQQSEQHLSRCREIMAAGENWRSLAGSAIFAEAVTAAADARLDEAELSFHQAVAAFHLSDPLREAETLYSRGRVLNTAGEAARGVQKIDAAIDIYRRSGAGERWIERASTAIPRGRVARPWNSVASFRREGDYWTLSFGGNLFRLKHSKGLDYIAHLLRRPGTELTAVELANLVDRAWISPTDDKTADPSQSGLDLRSDLGDAGALLDERAKEDYRRRLRELREELEETEQFKDTRRQNQILVEIDAVAAELKAAVGRNGIDRRSASHAERARSTVSKRIRFAIREISKANPSLERHLSESIRTGYKCSYLPKQKIEWEL
jgi:tetratricopeptide (TPR) repeat protein